jgi:hypothetical protein
MKKKLVRFTVKGSFRFPLDMLRYDQCWPADPTATANMEYSTESRSPEGYEVELLHWADGHWTPTEGRWASFGWHVDSSSIQIVV